MATDSTTGDHSYSNLGVAALEDGLAAQAGRAYAELLAERILDPPGMADTHLPGRAEKLPAPRATGREGASGRSTDPWLATGWHPAGIGVWSTAADLSRLLTGLIDGTAPGARPDEGPRPVGRRSVDALDHRRRHGRGHRGRRRSGAIGVVVPVALIVVAWLGHSGVT